MDVRKYVRGNATIVVYRPKLSEKELKKQEDNVKIALQQIGKEMKENEQWQQ